MVMKKKILSMLCVCAFAIILISIAIVIRTNIINNKARWVAEMYLNERYQESMTYKRVEHLPFMSDGGFYKVVFSPQSAPDIEFYVKVRQYPVLTTYEEKEIELLEYGNVKSVSDNYLLRKFKNEMEDILLEKIFDGYDRRDISIFVDGDYYIFQSPNLNENMSVYEAEKLMDYDVYIKGNIMNDDTEIESLFNGLQSLKNNYFSPNKVVFTTNKKYIYFEDWADIGKEEILARISLVE